MKFRAAMLSGVAALAISAFSTTTPANAEEDFWSSWLASAKEATSAVRAKAGDAWKKVNGVRITACFGSDWTKLVDDPAVTAAWEKETGNTVTFPRKGKNLLGSGDMLAGWDDNSIPCDLVSPDAGIAGFTSANWPDDSVELVASSFPVVVGPSDLTGYLKAHVNKDKPENRRNEPLKFTDFVLIAGKSWAEVVPDIPEAANWGSVAVCTANPADSASAMTFVTTLAYEASGNNKALKGRDVAQPSITAVLDVYRAKVAHTETSTGNLTQAFIRDPNTCNFIVTYESRLGDIQRSGMDVAVVRGGLVIQADRLVAVVAKEEKRNAAAISFLNHLQSPAVQKVVASDKIALRPSSTTVEVGKVVAELKKARFQTVRPPRDVVLAVLGHVKKPVRN